MAKREKKAGHQVFAETTVALAGLGTAIAAVVGLLAWIFAPTGLAGLLIWLGIFSAPFIVKASPMVAAVVAALAAVAGLARFVTWWKSRH